MLDSRIIDLSFNKIFLKLVLGEEVPLTIATLKVTFFCFYINHDTETFPQLVDPELANSLAQVQSIASDNAAPKDKVHTPPIFWMSNSHGSPVGGKGC